ncbi:MAG: hypothetical protein AAGK14_04890 [Verrucomicrobiota bacterium]
MSDLFARHPEIFNRSWELLYVGYALVLIALVAMAMLRERLGPDWAALWLRGTGWPVVLYPPSWLISPVVFLLLTLVGLFVLMLPLLIVENRLGLFLMASALLVVAYGVFWISSNARLAMLAAAPFAVYLGGTVYGRSRLAETVAFHDWTMPMLCLLFSAPPMFLLAWRRRRVWFKPYRLWWSGALLLLAAAFILSFQLADLETNVSGVFLAPGFFCLGLLLLFAFGASPNKESEKWSPACWFALGYLLIVTMLFPAAYQAGRGYVSLASQEQTKEEMITDAPPEYLPSLSPPVSHDLPVDAFLLGEAL